MKIAALFVSILFLIGCTATGNLYSDYEKNLSGSRGKMARIFIYRTGENSQYSMRAARISLNKDAIGKIKHKGFNVFEVVPGVHIIAADLWDSAGSCALPVHLEEGREYYFEVVPRTENLMAGLIFGVIGTAVESTGKQCSGPFKIAEVEKEAALSQLVSLKLTQ